MSGFDLRTLSHDLSGEVVNDSPDLILTNVSHRSDKATKGTLFVAIQGGVRDGHTYIPDAFGRGAVAAVVSEREALGKRPGIVVTDTRHALSLLAAKFAGNPSDEMKVVGVTGTNGKTTTNWIIFEALSRLGEKPLRLGTLGSFASHVINDPDTLTTPDALLLQQTLEKGKKGGVTSAVLEASSHALDQCRLTHVSFDVGIFTNLTRDHLDYHKNMESYFKAKRELFTLMAKGKKKTRGAVLNLDDPYGARLHAELKTFGLRDFSFGREAKAPIRIHSFVQELTTSTLVLVVNGEEIVVRTGLIGNHNANNLAGACGALLALGFTPKEISIALTDIPLVPGRLESIPAPGFGVYVDYAHTPDALQNALSTLRELVKGKLWVVFGCGGDRDKGKRPQMAEVAARLADKVVVTSDNPRTEDPKKIVEDILAGGHRTAHVDVDRARAIDFAIKGALKGDVILIAGKGHEDYQIIGTEKIHFADGEVAKKAIAARPDAGRGA